MSAPMRQVIKDVRVHVVRHEVAPLTQLGYASEQRTNIYLGVLRVFDAEGREGNSFIGLPISESDRTMVPAGGPLKSYLIGKSPSDREAIWHELRRLAPRWEVSDATVMAADVALWDLAAKGAGLPLYQFLGAYRHKAPAYGSAPTYKTVRENVEAAQRAKGQGFKGYKLHHVVPDRSEIVAVCSAVREGVGSDFALMYDGLRALDLRDALYVGASLDQHRYSWFEDPTTVHDLDTLAEISRRLATPVAVSDEIDFRLVDVPRVLSARSARIIRGEPAKDGITGMLKMAALCAAHHVSLEPHVGGNPLLDFAVLHVVLAIRNCTYFPLDVTTPRDRYVGLTENPRIDTEGFIQGPTRPGLGVEIDWAFIDRHAVAVL
jgi:L-alanine-DL-glutamate epimerase-like enolase superfamily enzyme